MSTWILLRGLTRESRHWGSFLETFRAAMPEANVVPLDLPGNGQLNGDSSPVSVLSMTEFCRAQLQRREVRPPYSLLAMSLGAMVAVNWIDRRPEEIERAVLINTSVRGLSPFYQRLRVKNYPLLLNRILLPSSAIQWERAILALTSRHPRVSDRVLEDWVAYRQDHPVSPRNAIWQLIAAARYKVPKTKPHCPVLLLASVQDVLVDARCSRVLADHWACDIAWHADAGHDIPLDDGYWVAKTVRAWVNGGRTESGQSGTGYLRADERSAAKHNNGAI